jgi:hypothetical protein
MTRAEPSDAVKAAAAQAAAERAAQRAAQAEKQAAELAAGAAAFETAITAFAGHYKQTNGSVPDGVTPVQERNYRLSDQCAYADILAAASKFRASDLFWIEPLQVGADGHARCSFTLAYFPAET